MTLSWRTSLILSLNVERLFGVAMMLVVKGEGRREKGSEGGRLEPGALST